MYPPQWFTEKVARTKAARRIGYSDQDVVLARDIYNRILAALNNGDSSLSLHMQRAFDDGHDMLNSDTCIELSSMVPFQENEASWKALNQVIIDAPYDKSLEYQPIRIALSVERTSKTPLSDPYYYLAITWRPTVTSA